MGKMNKTTNAGLAVWKKIDSFGGNTTSPVLTAWRPCPVCGGFECRTVLAFDDFQFYGDSAQLPKRIQVRQVQCSTCQAIFMNPGYSETGLRVLFAAAGNSFRSRPEHQVAQVTWLEQRGLAAPGQALLDVGCYDGRFLNMLPAHVRKSGVDMDVAAIERGRSLGLDLIAGAFEDFRLSAQPDVITMFHVLEHLADPYKTLRNLRRNSHAETRLIIEVPVIEKGFTNDLNGFLSIQHSTHFSFNSLKLIMQRAGWQILDGETMSYNGYRIVTKPGTDNVVDVKAGAMADRVTALRYLQSYFQNLADVGEKIGKWPNTSRAVIWGAGAHTEVLYQTTEYFRQDRDREYIMVDSAVTEPVMTWRGLHAYSPKAVLADIDWSDCALVISSYGWQDAIEQDALKAGVPQSAIRKIYGHVTTY